MRTIKARGAALKAAEQPIDTSTAAGKCFLDMLGVFAEFETNLRRERQLEGIARAKAEGVYTGRPASIDAAKVRAMKAKGMGPLRLPRRLASAGQASIGRWKPANDGGTDDQARHRRALGVQERVLLFCLASGTDWKQAGVTLKTVAGMVGKHFMRGPCRGGRALALTDPGRAALRALLRGLATLTHMERGPLLSLERRTIIFEWLGRPPV